MDYLPYMQRLQAALGSIRAADGIQEDSWFNTVMRELHDLSRDCAGELERETGIVWNKGTYLQHQHEAPPTRLLALVLPVAAWIGWVMDQKHKATDPLSSNGCLGLIREALERGVQLSKSGVVP